MERLVRIFRKENNDDAIIMSDVALHEALTVMTGNIYKRRDRGASA